MGNASSNPDYDADDPFDGIDTLGYRVLGVQPNSPASQAGLVSFLDFLVGADGQMLLGSGEHLKEGEEYEDVDLPKMLHENIGKPIEFLVWNIKSQSQRLVQLTPADDWGGAGLLGVTIRLDNYAGAEERLIRVLDIEPQSPASVAGLVSGKDFLLGTAHQTLDSTATLAALLRQHQDRVVELYVYNADSDLVRVVALMPTLEWGGGGLLGAEVGMGYLHRLPSQACQSDGASVERKVRTVSRGSAAQPVLELEPQLEMEQDDDSSDTASVEDVTPPRRRLIRHASSGDSSTDRPPHMPARVQSATGSESDHQGNGVEPVSQGPPAHPPVPAKVPVAMPPPPPPLSPEARRSSLLHHEVEEVQDVFSKPPPGSSVAQNQPIRTTNVLPPPPVMHYESPPPK